MPLVEYDNRTLPPGGWFVEGTVDGPYGARHAVVMARADEAEGWVWVFRPVLLPGERFEFRVEDQAERADWFADRYGWR